jgi:hypothetical protein
MFSSNNNNSNILSAGTARCPLLSYLHSRPNSQCAAVTAAELSARSVSVVRLPSTTQTNWHSKVVTVALSITHFIFLHLQVNGKARHENNKIHAKINFAF